MTVTVDTAERLERQLFLAVRQCATHTAGPLRTLSELKAAVDGGQLDASEVRWIAWRVAQRYAAQPGVPAERVEAVCGLCRMIARGV